MVNYNDIPSIEQFKDEYLEKLQQQKDLLKDAYVNALTILGSRTAEERFLEFEVVLQKVESLSNLDNKIKEIEFLKTRFEDSIQTLSSRDNNNDDKKEEKKKIEEVYDCLKGIINSLRIVTVDKITQALDLIIRNITNCPFGQEEGRIENALVFQKNAIELFVIAQ